MAPERLSPPVEARDRQETAAEYVALVISSRGSDTSWMKDAACKDLPGDIFFPGDAVGVNVAQKICRGCPVQEPCLEYALIKNEDHGVWGGTSERERRHIKRRRRLYD